MTARWRRWRRRWRPVGRAVLWGSYQRIPYRQLGGSYDIALARLEREGHHIRVSYRQRHMVLAEIHGGHR